MPRIRRLPDDLVNQIAAGEVVERPASVVKELVENAVDAQATRVSVSLAGGGLARIAVVDDGLGMSAEDAVLALERHATSKLLDADGLFHILTKGFRGEALPSIASVSRFTLTTVERGASAGVRVTVEGGGRLDVAPAGGAPGTQVVVEDLFFNVPARRKFLKQRSTELGHAEDALLRVALAHPEVAFTLEHEGRLLFSSPPAAPGASERIAAALGSEVVAHLLPVEERRLGLTVTGFVASPEFTLHTARGLYTFVNRRYTRDRGLTSAVQRAFQDTLPPGRQPVAVLFLEVEPREVDVNVHPQKLEVRFADPRGVQDAVLGAVEKALHAAPWRADPAVPSGVEGRARYEQAVERFLARVPGGDPLPAGGGGPGRVDPAVPFSRPSFGTAAPGLNDAVPARFFSALRFIGVWARRFWLLESPGQSLVVLDALAARQRVAFSALEEVLRGKAPPAVDGLFARSVTLDAPTAEALARLSPRLAQLGIEVEPFGAEAVLVRSCPAALADVPPQAWLPGLPEVLPEADAAAPDFTPALVHLARSAAPSPEALSASPSSEDVRAVLERLDTVGTRLVPGLSPALLSQTTAQEVL